MLTANAPALILAPMDGLTDAPMRAVQGETGAFTFAVSEFLRVSTEVLSPKTLRRDVPELSSSTSFPGGRMLSVQVQLLGGDPELMAQSAMMAVGAGAKAIDINFGCPAPTVNRHDGGATLLKYPCRIRDIVSAIRAAVPKEIPVSAKLRLGWDSLDPIHENAEMAAEGGASWLTIHGRTRVAGYRPPAYWEPIGAVRERLGLPVVANGDIWSRDDFRRCRDITGCNHFMLGRGALANPVLSHQVAYELGLADREPPIAPATSCEWLPYLQCLLKHTAYYESEAPRLAVSRIKQWLNIARRHGNFVWFDSIKRIETVEGIFAELAKDLRDTGDADASGPTE